MVSGQGTQIRGRVSKLATEILGYASDAPLPTEDSLSDLGMSSIKMVNLMLGLEREFDIMFPQADITPENFHSVATIEALVLRLVTIAVSA